MQHIQVRRATYKDAPTIKLLLETTDYKTSMSLLIEQIESVFDGKNNELLVCVSQLEIIAFAEVHYLEQLIERGGLAIVCFFATNDSSGQQGTAELLEGHVCKAASERKCTAVKICDHFNQKLASEFYVKQGYMPSGNTYLKKII